MLTKKKKEKKPSTTHPVQAFKTKPFNDVMGTITGLKLVTDDANLCNTAQAYPAPEL